MLARVRSTTERSSLRWGGTGAKRKTPDDDAKVELEERLQKYGANESGYAYVFCLLVGQVVHVLYYFLFVLLCHVFSNACCAGMLAPTLCSAPHRS